MPQAGYVGFTSTDTAQAKREIDEWLYDQVGGIVCSGPFHGMRLMREAAWKDAHLSPLLLGCYEEELHGIIEQQIGRLSRLEGMPSIVVVGAGEGYYAIGMKRRVPNAKVYAVEPSEESLAILERAAKENNVEILCRCNINEAMANPDLIIMDCEGNEVTYLDRDVFPSIVGAHVIVEVHNYPEQKTDDILFERFRGTHRIDMLVEGPRNPNKYKWLCAMISDYRWMAVSEGRPCLMGWFSMTPRGLGVA